MSVPNLLTRSVAISLILKERERQEDLKAEGRFRFTLYDDPGLSEDEKLLGILEEVAEVGKNLLARRGLVTDGDTTDAALLKEIVQIAALSLAWIERMAEDAGMEETTSETFQSTVLLDEINLMRRVMQNAGYWDRFIADYTAYKYDRVVRNG